MNIKTTLLILSIFLLTGCGSRRNFLETKQTSDEIVLDGSSEEWISTGSILVKDKIRYAFRNTEENVYILVEADDQSDIMQITRSGLNIWWNNSGKKKKKQGIRFPMMSPDEQFYNLQMGGMKQNPGPSQQGGMDFSAQNMEFDYVALLNFDDVEEQQLMTETAYELYGIDVSTGFSENNILVVEYKIPKKLIFGSKNQEKMAFLFETEEMEQPQMGGGGQGGPPGGGMGGGGMGSPPGGGMGGSPPSGGGGGMGGPPGGGGGPGGGQGQRPEASEISFWQFLKLSN